MTVATVRDWLQLFRSHTSPLEMLIAGTGAALASGTVWSWNVLLFVLFGWLYHNAGYGHNSVEDFIRGYDKDDPHKSHHPLQRGAIDPRTGRTVTLVMIASSFVFGMVIATFDPVSIAILAVLTASGFVYNVFGKRMGIKFLPIAIAHSLLLPFAFFGSGGEMGCTLWVVAILSVCLVLQIVYQIMIEGDLKDIGMSESSFLGKLGVYVKDGRLHVSSVARTVSFAIKAVSILGFLSAMVFQGFGPTDLILVVILSTVLLIIDGSLMRSGPYDHIRTLRTMALMEVASTFALIAAVSPTIGGPLPALALMALGILYFILMNRFLWGTGLVPKV
jgi:1,4-dihydroxy-2-naphthoate octaprenyltransferase